MVAAEGREAPKPALGRSTVLNREGLDKVLPMVAADSIEWGPTKILMALTHLAELAAIFIALHLPALFSGLFPQFSEFFNALLMHYQIRALYLDLGSALILSSFAFLYESFLGVPTLVALFRNFFSLRLTAPDQCSGSMFFQAVDETAGECVDMRINQTAEAFRRKWVFVDMGQYNPCC
ncbi:hypothetical protein D1007_25392 [Hordeum vulgare]|nr:hypothetical protein D1007_25392 [Hordeum vulgare]